MADLVMNASDTLNTVNNVAYKVELALYRLYKAVTGAGYTKLMEGFKDPLKSMLTKIQDVLKTILTKVKEVIEPFLDKDVLTMFKEVLGAGRDLVNSTLDLLPATVQNVVETSRRFLNVIVDFVSIGIDHIAAIVDLLMNVGLALAGQPPTLKPITLEMVKKTEALLLPEPITVDAKALPAGNTTGTTPATDTSTTKAKS
ncbi:hypothetical protein [Archangium lipolyticum]|uniref:hypothetical protein n=1 Tax=Archangium lipolyticum TaxID=2970465 RepID=UPI002149D051|nr:hypothetical protein [Archangium lipolyticum]